ncbi:class I SAM-dependent methyltransferase [Clostridium sporogenes]
MLNNNDINNLFEVSKRPNLFERGTGNIWTEEYISKQMLSAHLNPNFDGASRNSTTIDKTINFLNTIILKNSVILDLGCGPGLYAEKLCRSGHLVTGIDFSEHTIKYAKNSAKKQELNIEYKCEDMFSINYNNQYDVVIQIYGEINTFSDRERNRLFTIVKNALKQDGLFIFDVSTPKHRRKNRLNKNWYMSECGFWRGDRHIVFEEGFEFNNDIWLDQYIVIDNEEIKVYRNWFQDYTRETIKKIVLESGFKNVKVIESLTGEDISIETEWITVIAQK